MHEDIEPPLISCENQLDIINDITDLILKTTNYNLIFDTIIKKIENILCLSGMAYFQKQGKSFIFQSGDINETIKKYFQEVTLDFSELNIFNGWGQLDIFPFYSPKYKYGLILPLSKQELSFGFLFFVSSKKEIFNAEILKFLRLIRKQLFFVFQRQKLLADTRHITKNVEFASLPVFLVKSNYEFLYINKKAEDDFNLLLDNVIGKKIHEIFYLTEEMKSWFYSKIELVFEKLTNQLLKIEFSLSPKKRKTQYFVQLTPTVSNLTNEYCVVMSLIDTSGSVKLQSIAEEYQRRHSYYMSILGHDIKDILFALYGYSQLLQKVLPLEKKTFVNKIDEITKKGTVLIQDITILGKILDTSTDRNLNEISLEMIINNSIRAVEVRFDRLSTMIDVILKDNLMIVGNWFLSTFFEYLIFGLCQLMDKTGKILVIGEEGEYNNKPTICVSFYDNNIIPLETLYRVKRVFDLDLFEGSMSKYLPFIIVKEIAFRCDYSIEILKIKRNKNEKREIIRVFFPLIDK